MTETEFPQIKPEDARDGDRLRVTRYFDNGDCLVHEFTVVSHSPYYVGAENMTIELSDEWRQASWQVLNRVPWRKQLADELREWARKESRSARYCSEYETGSVDSARRIANWIEERTIGAAIPDTPTYLTPISDHGDGCSPWLWDEDTDTAWVACDVEGSAVTHQQMRGKVFRGGELLSTGTDATIAARLRPWSERGQK